MITDPLSFNAENAYPVLKIVATSLSMSDATEELSPPYAESPQVTTDPSFFSAAKAYSVLKMLITPLVRSDAIE